jgi:hypothetical protein
MLEVMNIELIINCVNDLRDIIYISTKKKISAIVN